MADNRQLQIIAAILWFGFAALTWFVTHHMTAAFDRWGLLLFRTGADLGPRGPEGLVDALLCITAVGGGYLRNLFALAAVAVLVFKKRKRDAKFYALTVMTGEITNLAVKQIVARERPQIVPHLTDASGMSFPSGHSFASTVVYILMALIFGATCERRWLRLAIVGLAVIVSASIACSRVMLGVHFPSDALAGWLGGAALATTAAALFIAPNKITGPRH